MSEPSRPLPDPAALWAAVRDRQLAAWIELHNDIEHTPKRDLSVRGLALAEELVRLIHLTGPAGWREVPWPLVAGDIYAEILRRAYVQPPTVTADEASPWGPVRRHNGRVRRVEALLTYALARGKIREHVRPRTR